MEKSLQNDHIEKLSKQFKPLYQFFVDGIKDIYWAEQAIENLLKKNKALAYTDELSDALENHELQTHKHSLRLEKVFKHLNMKPEAKKCEAVAGIIKEAEECIGKTPENSMTRDAVIIICAQKIEHYEIATYGGLLQIALTLDLDKVADALEKTLEEEEDTDCLLSDIAESFINIEAAEEDELGELGTLMGDTDSSGQKSKEDSKKSKSNISTVV